MDQETNKILTAIHKDYVKQLPKRIIELELKGLQILDAQPADDSLRVYYKELHDLSGSSGTHGYKELSKVLRELDKLFSNFLQKGMSAVNKEEINALFAQAKSASLIPPDTPDMFKE